MTFRDRAGERVIGLAYEGVKRADGSPLLVVAAAGQGDRNCRRKRVDNVGPYLRRAGGERGGSRARVAGGRRSAWRERRNGDCRGLRGFEHHPDDAVPFRQRLKRPSPPNGRTGPPYWADLPQAEIAAAMGCSAGALTSYQHRGVQRLIDLVRT